MAFPQVQRAKMEALKAENPQGDPRPPATNKANAVVSMTPGPPAIKPPSTEAAIDENEFAVTPTVKVEDRVAPRETETIDVNDTERNLSIEEQEAEQQRKWKSESPDLYHRYKTVTGMFEKQKHEVRELKDSMRQLTEQVQQLKAAPTPAARAPEPVVPGEELSPEQIERYQDAFPVIESLGKKTAQKLISELIAPMQEELKELREKTGTVAKSQAEIDESSFVNNVKSRVKNMDSIVKTPEWNAFLDQKIPMTRATVRDVLLQAHNDRDLDGVTEIFNTFKPESRASIEELVTPHKNGAGGNGDRMTLPKATLKMSGRKQASEDFRKKRISQDRFNQIETMYKDAERDGRIDYNA